MKYLFSILITGLLLSCFTQEEAKEEVTSSPFEFLQGNWERVNDKDGTQTYENWAAVEGNQWKGLGVGISGTDTVFYEEMLIASLDGTWKLEVKGPNESPVYFEMKEQTDTAFTATNPNHDFPKEIKYWLDSDTLKAKVSGDEMSIDFAFVRR